MIDRMPCLRSPRYPQSLPSPADVRAQLRRYLGVATDEEVRAFAHRALEVLGDIGANAIAA